MEQYPVPQFIEEEGKITAFLSFRQFFFLIGAGVICLLLYYILPRTIFYMVAIIIVAGAIGLGFIRINGVSLLDYILSSFGFSIGGKNYTWKKRESPYPFKTIKRAAIRKIETGPVLKAQESQLKKSKTSIELKTR
jgi:hypothetical protein